MSIQARDGRRSGVKVALLSAAVAALALGPGVSAAPDAEFVKLGEENVAVAPTSIRNTKEDGIGIVGVGDNAGLRGDGNRFGVVGVTFSKEGSGVFGLTGAPRGGFGVQGIATGAGVGVEGLGASVGVSGTGGEAGVKGFSSSRNGSGVRGDNDAFNGVGVKGTATNPDAGVGVLGRGNTAGVIGRNDAEPPNEEEIRSGVIGEGHNGVAGRSPMSQGLGVLGEALAEGGTGVLGRGDETGVVGIGRVGMSAQARGPGGIALSTTGKLVFSRSGIIRFAKGSSLGSACGFALTADSKVIATVQALEQDSPSVRAAKANPGDGCVSIRLTSGVPRATDVAYLILD